MWALTTAAAALGYKSMPFKIHSHGTGKVLVTGDQSEGCSDRTLHPSELCRSNEGESNQKGSYTQTEKRLQCDQVKPNVVQLKPE